jgi:rubrerythrin
MPESDKVDRHVPRVGLEAEAEPLSQGSGVTRADLLGTGVAAGGALIAGGILIGGLAKPALSKPSAAQDARVLDFLLQVEYLQAGFYRQVGERRRLRGELRDFASTLAEQERAHVAALKRELGHKASKEPALDFADATSDPQRFVATAVQLEEIAVAAYNGQATNLTKGPLLTALKIVSVEARHVAWARDLAHRNPAPRPADRPATQSQATAAMRKTGFMH